MTAAELKASILDRAVHGLLVPQDPNDEPAAKLLAKIAAEKKYLLASGKIKKQKPLPPITDDEKPFDLPDGWEWVRLGSICSKIGAGSTPKGGANVYVTRGIKLLREQNVHDDGLRLDNVVFITKEINDAKPGSQVKPKDILVNITGASIGRNSLVPDDFDTANVNQHVLIVRLIDYDLRFYVHECLRSPLMLNLMYGKQTGDKPGLSAEKVMAFPIPLPPLAEQKRIVAKIEELMPLVEEYGKAETELAALNDNFPTALRKSILQHAVEGHLTSAWRKANPRGETAAELLAKIVAEKKHLLASGKIKKQKPLPPITDDEKPFPIPDSWAWARLGEIATKFTDGSHRTPNYTTEGIPFVSVKDMSTGKLNLSNTKFISPKEHEELYQRCNPEVGDLLISKVGTTGIPAIVETATPFSLFVSVALMKFSHHLLDAKFLYYTIFSPHIQQQAKKNTKGEGNKNWVIDLIRLTTFPLPPLAEQKAIVERVEELLGLVEKMKG